MRAERLDRRCVLRLGVLGVAAAAAGCAGAGPASAPSGRRGVGTTGSGAEAGCPKIMSHLGRSQGLNRRCSSGSRKRCSHLRWT